MSQEKSETSPLLSSRQTSTIEEHDKYRSVEQKIEIYEQQIDDKQFVKYNPNEFKTHFQKRKRLCPLTLWYSLIVIIYIICILVGIFMPIIHFIDIISLSENTTQDNIDFFSIIFATWIGCIIAIIIIKLGFSIKGQTEELKTVNEDYWGELQRLKKRRYRLMKQLKLTRNNVRELTAENEKMQNCMHEFGDLVTEFESLKNIFPKKFDKTLNKIKDTDSILRTIEAQNHRAKLYAAYFDASGKNDKPGLSRKEFNKFLSKIPNAYSNKFKQVEDVFDKIDQDGSGNISKYEFEKAVQKVIHVIQEEEDR
eukprot:327549_1